jgi:alginate O-acetyltransferase complex protein AlgI
MLFNSGHFFFFFLVFYLLYILIKKNLRLQNGLLLAASYFFYGFWDYHFLGLLLVSTAVDFIAGQQIELFKAAGKSSKARYWLWLSVIVNLGILGFFKYFNFFIDSFTQLLGAFGLEVMPYTLEIILPVGISFYTFQTMSYTIDVYRGRQPATRDPLNFALYVSFFPQLMAGPIERARKLLPQIERKREIGYDDIREGGWLLLWGIFKKVYIADNLAPYSYWAFIEGGATTALDVYLAIIAFSIQIYCDFSGYSDMARGMARMMGFRLSLNFNLPFLAPNPSELWRRWHITLANWFRDYVYAELRKWNRLTLSKNICVIITMFLVGLWHGAAWNYVIWGTLWGIALSMHRWMIPSINRLDGVLPGMQATRHWLGVLLTFHIWIVIGVFYAAPGLEQAWLMEKAMLTGFDSSVSSGADAIRLLAYCLPLVVVQAFQHRTHRLNIMHKQHVIVRAGVYTTLLLLLWTNGAVFLNEFLYFQF